MKSKEIVKNREGTSDGSEEQVESPKKGSLKKSLMSSVSIFSDMNLSVLIKQALKHPTIEKQTKMSLDFVENNTAYLSEIMNTCNGRDKLLAIIQYSWGWYVKCLKKTNPMEVNLNKKSYLRWKRISSNLSSGRKVFRLLKFSDELSSIIKYTRGNKKTTLFQDILFYSSGIWSFFYYLLDNIIWLSSKKYKFLSRMKDLFSLARCIIEIWKWLHEIAKDLKNEEKILKKLGLYDGFFVSDTEESYGLIRDLIKLRRQMSFYVLDLVTNVLRVFMLFKSLKFYGSIYLDSIFVELCGVFSSFFALLKSVKKKSFEKTAKRDNEKKENKDKKVTVYEEEKKSKDLFDINNMEMSVDDSDIEDQTDKYPKFSNFNVTKFGAPVSSIGSTQITSSFKSNGKLKHVKSSQDVNQNGIIKGVRSINP